MAPPWDRYGVRARRIPEDSREGGDCKPHKKGHTPGTIWAGARSGGRKPDQYAQPWAFTTECAQPECAFPSPSACRMRFFVRVCSQNAPFRRMRLFLPGQTWHRLTEKHILYSSSYGKAHSSPGGVTKNHILDELCEKHDLHMCVHHYADLEKPEDDESFIRR